MSSGIVPVAPGIYTVTEVRAPARGGLPAAEQAVLADATVFCGQQQRKFVPVGMGPGGDPRDIYGPSAFTATFACLLPGDPAVARFRADDPLRGQPSAGP
jgi:hypothetical protein